MDAKELRNLQEAYLNVYEDTEQLDEGHGSRRSFKQQSKDERWRVNTFNRPGSNVEYTPHKNYDPEANRGQGQILRPNQAEKQRRKKLAKAAMGEGYDLYDIILSHLLDEGYAETIESAEAIMVNMSEEWRESICEEIGIVGPPKKAIDAIPGVRALRIAASNAVKASDYPAGQDVPMAGKHVIPTDRYGTTKPRPMTSSEMMRSRASGTGMRMPGYKDISGD